jgi:hypothetical protein
MGDATNPIFVIGCNGVVLTEIGVTIASMIPTAMVSLWRKLIVTDKFLGCVNKQAI